MFIDYYQGTGRLMADWNATFRNWLRKAKEFEPKKPQSIHPTGSTNSMFNMIYDVSEQFKNENTPVEKDITPDSWGTYGILG